MYVILTSKPGIFHIEHGADVRAVEIYDYRFYGKIKARFVIAEIDRDAGIRVVEDEPPHVANQVSTKFLDHFTSIEDARKELRHLASFGSIDTELVPVPPNP